MVAKAYNTSLRLQFSLRALFLFVTVVAVSIVVIGKVRSILNGNYDEIVAGLKSVHGIDGIHVCEIDQGFGEINAELVTFRIADKSGSFVELWSPHLDIFDNATHIGVGRVGAMMTCVSCYDSEGKCEGGGCADLGSQSDLAPILPFTPRNLKELIERYDELEAYFQTWPEYPDTGKLVISPTRSIRYYREKPR